MEIKKASRRIALHRARAGNPALFDRVMRNADTSSPTQCWTWLKAKDRDGYGSLKVAGKSMKAHRAAHSLFYPHIIALVVRHLCNNPACVNPLHLRAGTPKDNALDRVLAKRGGFLKGEANGRAKLTAEQVITIRSSAASGAHIARDLGISRVLVSRIRRGVAWTHI